MSREIVVSGGRELAGDDEELRELQGQRFQRQAEQAIRDGTPPNTLRAYMGDFKRFEAWCAEQRPVLAPMPTTESALLGYLTYLDTKGDGGQYRCRAGTIERRLAGIIWGHAVMNIASPVTPRVSKVLHAIKVRRVKEGEPPPRMAAPLTLDDLRQIARWLDANPSALATRNRAVLLTGWVCAMRRSEIADLMLSDIGQISDRGFMLTIRRGKADQLGRGRQLPVTAEPDESLCPVAALRAWLAIRGDAPGPLFWRTGWLKNPGRPLGEKQVSRTVLALVKKAGLVSRSRDMDFSAHSLRAGFITEAVRAGQHDRQVMDRSGHKTHEVFLRYVRMVQSVDANAATGFTQWKDKDR